MTCRSCGGRLLDEIWDAGSMPLVNNLLEYPEEDCPRWPLKLVRCADCTLVQLAGSPAPAAMFDDYRYYTSQSRTMIDHAAGLVDLLIRPGMKVVEIGSNDGYLLSAARKAGAEILGVEPAANIAGYAQSRGVPTRCEYFNQDAAGRIRDEFGPADMIFALNVLAHLPDPNELAAGLADLLSENGRACIEVPWLAPMIELCAFDSIYHEHHCYFSARSLQSLLHRHGLRMIDVEEIDIHCGSIRAIVARSGTEDAAERLIAYEQEIGLEDGDRFDDFGERVDTVRQSLIKELEPFDRVAAYGAAAKGVVLLNVCGLGTNRIAWVADVSPHKQERFIPGTGQPIVDPTRLIEEMPQACLILPWNIADEIGRLNRDYTGRGGNFILPFNQAVTT